VNGMVTLLAIGLLAILVLVFLRNRMEAASTLNIVQLPAAVPAEERRQELLDRIFGPEDWEFVLSSAPKDVQRLFLRERKEIAFCWLHEIRNQAKAVMQFHLAHAKRSEHLRPFAELRLLIDYFLIRAKCGLVAAVLWLRGPMALRKMVKQAGGLSHQLRSLFELASKLEPLPIKTKGS
jgi:hypothetical protein